ncbi:hypothetical protein DFO66_10950 [Brevibacterium sanguinis]|uniref:Flagellar biosynthetic protein FliP n=3 Tax=Brevibacteriaceae TaxID=85019 RepID=A0A366IHZ1_9MICO|nr:hypothetical protein DFO66_10950 [Brevibacterium sanguinis]RBP70279.1 hypothetical protein DFO65_10950 [Brevibacterium celere]
MESMTTTTHSLIRSPAALFIRHYLEMVIAMIAGMMILGPLESLLFAPFGWDDLRAIPEIDVLIMATNMTVPMVALMLVQRHSASATALMAAAMYLPFLVLFPFVWTGVMSHGALLGLGHTLMFVAMFAAMWVRRDEYIGHRHHSRDSGARAREEAA